MPLHRGPRVAPPRMTSSIATICASRPRWRRENSEDNNGQRRRLDSAGSTFVRSQGDEVEELDNPLSSRAEV